MTDCELLKLAAVAAAYVGAPIGAPLDDDGDALRLAVLLRLDVRHSRWPNKEKYATAQKIWHPQDSMYYDDGVSYCGDPCAATRRAIVRAAAEIGRKTKAP